MCAVGCQRETLARRASYAMPLLMKPPAIAAVQRQTTASNVELAYLSPWVRTERAGSSGLAMR